MIVCSKEKIVISLDSFYKTKKANMFFFLSGFSFTGTDDSQDSRGRESIFLLSMVAPEINSKE